MLNKLDRPNILIILLDGVRPDRIRDNRDFATIKSKGIFCNNMFTTSPYTLASLHSLLLVVTVAQMSGMYTHKN